VCLVAWAVVNKATSLVTACALREAAVANVVARIKAVYQKWSPSTTATQMRLDWDQLFSGATCEANYQACTIAEVSCAWIASPASRPDQVILYLHGGGFRVGSSRSHFELMADLSSASGCRVLGVDYRLAPEDLFPAALIDVCAVYEGLLRQGFHPGAIAIAGDSAGAGLALSAMLALKDAKRTLPGAAYLMSPWTDLSASGESYETHAKLDPLHRRSMIQAMAQAYLGADADPRQALASPLFGDLKGLPPLLIHVGDLEVLLSDSVALTEACRAANVAVHLKVWEGMVHVFQQFPKDFREAGIALSDGGAFLRQHLI
jgi:epsilon-lactone hydrolase